MPNPAQKLSTESGSWLLNITRVFDHSIEDVFNAWTDPEQLLKWFCHDGDAEFDIAEGGRFHVFIKCDTNSTAELKGEYIEIIKNKKLVFTWVWQNEPLSHAGNTVVTVEFVDLGGSTEVKLLHEGFSSEEFCNNHTEGWNEALNRYEKAF